MTPKVSVIMSFCDNEKYIRLAVESILKQTFVNFEFTIVNDDSQDASEKIIQSFSDNRIKFIKNPKNLGLTRSLNKALKLAKAEYIARMDADDIAEPDRFAKQVEFLDKNQKVGLVGSWVEFINSQGKTTGIRKFPTSNFEIRKALTSYLPFRHPTLMIRKNVLNDIGFYDENFRFAQDYELVLRISAKYKLANLPEVLLKYRNWPAGSISLVKQKQQEFFALKARFKALKNGWVPTWQLIYLIKPAISFLIPSIIKKPLIKKFVFKIE